MEAYEGHINLASPSLLAFQYLFYMDIFYVHSQQWLVYGSGSLLGKIYIYIYLRKSKIKMDGYY